MPFARVPLSTYRLQFRRRFRFEDARALVPYLETLGVTDLYASPLLNARKGSSHGYDVTDPTRLNPDLGTEGEFDALVGALQGRRIGLLLDIVPNHMSASSENRWWMDVLENGAGSSFAPFFDIDWHSPKKALERKVLLPVLGGPYGRVLENRELSLRLERGRFFVHYHGVKLPLALKSYGQILAHRLEVLEENFGPDHPSFREMWDLISDIEHLPEPVPTDPARAGERLRVEEEVRERLLRLHRDRAEIRAHIDETLRIYRGTKGDPASFDHLDRLLAEQPYWLSFWRLANEEINYRRFFAISDLISIRVEDPKVFDATHDLVLRLAREGKVTGLRVDHIDGLYDPMGYLTHLRNRLAPENATGGPAPSFYVVVEKILADGEDLPAEWPVSGTTGYDFLNLVNGVFVGAVGTRALGETYARFLGETQVFETLVYEKKKMIMETLFAGEMHSLGQHLGRLAEQDRYGRDLPRKELQQALVEVTACFPVYRTYIRGFDISARDRRYLGKALKEATRRGAEASAPVFDFLRRVLLLEGPAFAAGEQREEWLRFLMRWQQFSGPIMAKGFEDTSLYVYNRLTSQNEVGGHPAGLGVPVSAFHKRAGGVAARWPYTMSATTTHDTKRSEDVRARINVLSELPEEWEKRLLHWSDGNRALKRTVDGRAVPDPSEETLLYQTLLGAWPLDPGEMDSFPERVRDYMLKAVREAKVHTRWIRPNPEHERAVRDFVTALLVDGEGAPFREDFLPFQTKIAHYGALNGLAQVLLKIASPGIPDFYQGSELWDLRLVDPDNRGPVDFSVRTRLLAELASREEKGLLPLIGEIVPAWQDGRIKLYLTWRALNFRRERRELFLSGEYHPLSASGGNKDHVLAFARKREESWAVMAVPRLVTRLSPPGEFPLGQKAWGTKSSLVLPEGAPQRWRNAFTGEEIRVSPGRGKKTLPLHAVFRYFPVALLANVPD
ncbi:MAG: malto-oligosyltrehalose synthase [Deltaproteobacteria bacterium]|nr:MAG: malto-oligosyltrehalose synthase [Deltaproteobacteria bacterium]